MHHIATVHESGPQRGHELHRDQVLDIKEGEYQVQDVAQIPGSQLVH